MGLMSKKPKVLYRMTTEEREFAQHLDRQVATAVLALRQFLSEVASRERLPSGLGFDAKAFAFVQPPEPQEPPKA